MCTVGHDIWTARVPLICFDVVEWHLPDRVLRQFGQTQGIPEQFDTSQGLHRIDRRGRARIDWRIRHAQYIDIWDARRDHSVHGDPILRGRSYTDDYMAWFFSITVRVIGQSQYAVSGYEGESSTVRLLVRLRKLLHVICVIFLFYIVHYTDCFILTVLFLFYRLILCRILCWTLVVLYLRLMRTSGFRYCGRWREQVPKYWWRLVLIHIPVRLSMEQFGRQI